MRRLLLLVTLVALSGCAGRLTDGGALLAGPALDTTLRDHTLCYDEHTCQYFDPSGVVRTSDEFPARWQRRDDTLCIASQQSADRETCYEIEQMRDGRLIFHGPKGNSAPAWLYPGNPAKM